MADGLSMVMMAGALLGGLGLFLVGMWLMTDGLKLAAGGALRRLLAEWTSTRARGLFAGFGITALVQSSSAVTVATIGFANAGLLTLERSIWVIFGSNVGTTMTGWIVALVGFKLNMEALALPLVGVGMLLKLSGEGGRRGAIGLAVVGFGLLFLGIGALKEAFEAVGHAFTLPAVEGSLVATIGVFVLVGVLLTTLMQSSSAALVIALGAAEGGLIPLNAAAAVVIGANLGTTTTALLAVWGATATAKRVAVSHVMFNLATALVAALLLAPMLFVVTAVRETLGLADAPATALALFHTVFNILGVLLMWPLARPMTTWLAQRFVTQEELASRPRFIDDTALALPAIAAQALTREVARLFGMALAASQAALSVEHGDAKTVDRDAAVAESLADAIGRFVTALGRTSLPANVAPLLPLALRTTQRGLAMMDTATAVSRLRAALGTINDAALEAALSDFVAAVARATVAAAPDEPGRAGELPGLLDAVKQARDELRRRTLAAGAAGTVGMPTVDTLLSLADQGRRAARQAGKGRKALDDMAALLAGGEVADTPAAAEAG
ncbi:MAG: Na/Pi cotransporter family protein [Gammaproteobacteria bacterium]